MNREYIFKLAYYAAILGNVVFIIWILSNGLDEGFKGTAVQIASYLSLIFLLTLNSVLLFLKGKS